MGKRISKENRYYVDNALFLVELIKFREGVAKDPHFRIPEYIGKCILLICEKLSTRGNFSGYTYRDEMCDDAVEDCLVAVKNFDPTILGKAGKVNPFGYFGRIAWWAMVQRIAIEKKQQYLKHKNFQNNHLLDSIDMGLGSELSDQVIQDFEEAQRKSTPAKTLTKHKKTDTIRASKKTSKG